MIFAGANILRWVRRMTFKRGIDKWRIFADPEREFPVVRLEWVAFKSG